MMKISYVKQTDLRDCGVACLLSIIKYYGEYARRDYLREITKTTIEGVSVYSLVECAKTLGMEAKALKGDILNIKDKVPFIAHVILENKLGHFVVVSSIKDKTIKVMDPGCGFKVYTKDEWDKITTNVYIVYKPKNNILKQVKEKSFFKIIFSILKKYSHTFIIITFFSFLYTILQVLISYQFKLFLKLNNQNINYLLILFILILVLKELTKVFRSNLINYLNHSLDYNFITEIYHHIIRLPYLYFKNHTKGDIITRFEDIFKIRNIISKFYVTLSMDLVFGIVILIVIHNINVKAFLIIIGITIIYMIIITIYNNIISKKITELKQSEVRVNNHLIESISSIDTIKGMNIEEMLDNKMSNIYSNFQDKSFDINKNIIIENFFKEIVLGSGLLLIIYNFVINSTLDISELIVLYNLFIIYFDPINNICSLHMEYKEVSVSFIRIKELLDSKIEYLNIDKKCINKHLLGNIEINNLIYSYNGIDDIVKCKNLSINATDKVLLYGNSGGGKSTLMKLFCRYIGGYKGSILIDNRNIQTYNLLDIRRKITYVSQDETIYTDTIYNNIVLNNNIKYEEYLKIIKMIGINSIFEKSLLGDEMILDNNGLNLSGGERQRIILARSLVKNSDIYIFDEILNAIDVKSERQILKNIFSYLKNKTVIVISHRFNNRDLYQKFVMIKEGVVYEY